MKQALSSQRARYFLIRRSCKILNRIFSVGSIHLPLWKRNRKKERKPRGGNRKRSNRQADFRRCLRGILRPRSGESYRQAALHASFEPQLSSAPTCYGNFAWGKPLNFMLPNDSHVHGWYDGQYFQVCNRKLDVSGAVVSVGGFLGNL